MRVESNVANQGYRDLWVKMALKDLKSGWSNSRTPTLLDVGAGQMPYKEACEALGFSYSSHDFNKYSPDEHFSGLHVNWPNHNHEFECDILDIPETKKFDVILCTEVLEHIPDPITAISKFGKLLHPKGKLILTAPLLSLIHQAPFHFSAGFTEYWYRYWLPKAGFADLSLTQHGDYADLLSQEIRRFLRLPGIFQKPISKLLRPFVGKSLLSAGGFSMFLVAEVGEIE